MSIIAFLSDVIRIGGQLKMPSFMEVLGSIWKAVTVVSISALVFASIDSIVMPVAKFLLNS